MRHVSLALLALLAGSLGVLAQDALAQEAIAQDSPAGVLTQGAAPGEETFAGQGFGYTAITPRGWGITRPGAYTILIGPSAEIAGGPVSVSIENVRLPDNGGAMAAIDTLVNRYLTEMRNAATQIEIHRQAPFRWDTGEGGPVIGQQVVADFTRDGLPYRQWAVFLPSPLGPVAHVWLYTTPPSLFDDWRPAAESVLRSMRPAVPPAK